MSNLSPVGKPRPVVALLGEDGNAFSILGRVRKALIKAGYTNEEVQKYRKDAMSGDYDHLLAVTLDWVDEPEDGDDD